MANPKVEIIKRPIEQASSNIKKSAWSSAFESFAILVLGILFVIWPDTMMQAVAYIIGAILLVKGGFEIISYFIDEKNTFSNLLLSGLVSTFIGIVVMIMGPNIANVFRIVIAIFLVYESLVRVSSAVRLYQAGLKIWEAVAILALIIMVLGIFDAVNDAASIIGWALVVAGLMGIIGDVIFIRQIDKVVASITGSFSKEHKR